MKKILTIGVAMIVIVGSGVGIYWLVQNKETTSQVAGSQTTIFDDISVKINTEVKKVPFQPNITALMATKIATDGEVVTQGEGADAYILEIAHQTADKNNREYWELLVNDQPALLGAGSLILRPGDSIEWKISKF